MEKDIITFTNPQNVAFYTVNREWVRVLDETSDQRFSLEEYDVVVTLEKKKTPEPRELWVRNDKRADPRSLGFKEPEGLESGDAVFINAIGYVSWNAKGVFYSPWDAYEGNEATFKVIPYFLYWFDFHGVAYDD